MSATSTIHYAQHELCIGVSLFGGFAVPHQGLLVVRLHAHSTKIRKSQVVLCIRIPLLGSFAVTHG
jgi:hypothetical protein